MFTLLHRYPNSNDILNWLRIDRHPGASSTLHLIASASSARNAAVRLSDLLRWVCKFVVTKTIYTIVYTKVPVSLAFSLAFL